MNLMIARYQLRGESQGEAIKTSRKAGDSRQWPFKPLYQVKTELMRLAIKLNRWTLRASKTSKTNKSGLLSKIVGYPRYAPKIIRVVNGATKKGYHIVSREYSRLGVGRTNNYESGQLMNRHFAGNVQSLTMFQPNIMKGFKIVVKQAVTFIRGYVELTITASFTHLLSFFISDVDERGVVDLCRGEWRNITQFQKLNIHTVCGSHNVSMGASVTIDGKIEVFPAITINKN